MSPEKKDTRTRKILAQKLRLLRFTRGWSQEVLAGLHRTYVSSIERGERNVSIDNLEKLADAFALSVSELRRRPSLEDMKDRRKDFGIEEPRAHYGPVAVEMVH